MERTQFVKLIKEVLFNSPLRKYCFPFYFYNFTPPQLCFLCRCLEETKNVAGAVAEIGCSSGYTTVFMNKYMDALNIEKNYYAIDTFSGFVAEDIEYEVKRRGKKKKIFDVFRGNKKKWFDGAMKQNNITRVRSIAADANQIDLKFLAPLAFCLLDVDLYRPTRKALPQLYEILSPGGIIIVDDCDAADVRWDGAHQAYREFMREIKQDVQIVHEKLGVIKK